MIAVKEKTAGTPTADKVAEVLALAARLAPLFADRPVHKENTKEEARDVHLRTA